MADVERKYELIRFSSAERLRGMDLVVSVIPVGSRRLTHTTGAMLTVPAQFTREEIVNGLRSLADALEKQLT